VQFTPWFVYTIAIAYVRNVIKTRVATRSHDGLLRCNTRRLYWLERGVLVLKIGKICLIVKITFISLFTLANTL